MDSLLVDPVEDGRLPADELLGLEPERDLLREGGEFDAADPDTFPKIVYVRKATFSLLILRR